MDVYFILKIIVLLFGFYMAWNIGAQDVSNAMGTSVGSGALTLRRAVIVAAIFEFSGAFFAGSEVAETIQRGIIDTSMFVDTPLILILGMTGALLGTGIWLQVASFFGWPVSTTHAIVGAVIGFGLIIGGIGAIQWSEVRSIALSWVISPLVSGVISYLIFLILQKKILFTMTPMASTIRLYPLLIFILFSTFSLSLLFNGLESLHVSLGFTTTFMISIAFGALCAIIAFMTLKKTSSFTPYRETPSLPNNVVALEKAVKHLQRVRLNTHDETHAKVSKILSDAKALTFDLKQETSFEERASEYNKVEKMFVSLQIFSACFIAFSHGSNDTANAIGPVAAVLDLINKGTVTGVSIIPSWLLAFGGVGIVVGLATWGWRVIETIGRKITVLTPTRGFSAEFGAATTILVASKLGLPISTTHCLVGAVLGVGLARGLSALNLATLRDIMISWLVTLPASALMSILIFYILKFFFISV